jgi:predicted nucleic acid-binding protein
MTQSAQSISGSYVLDTSAAINLERSGRLGSLPPPGNWIILPPGVAREMNPDNPGTPEATKKWLAAGRVAHLTDQEESLYRELILNPAADDGEAQAIAMAYYRGAVLVIDEKKTGELWRISQSYSITCVTSEELFNKIKPRLPGL